MNFPPTFSKPSMVFALSCAMVGLLFFLQGNVGFNLADEGFLWYGAQRVLEGELPVRDFMAYDPGRYYWSAAIMSLLSDNGIMALRISMSVFSIIGMFLALNLLRKEFPSRDYVIYIAAAMTFTAWMFPRHKLFDITVSISLVAVLTFLLKQPGKGRFFVTGLVVGLAAVIGQNHGVYGLIGSLLTIGFIHIRQSQSSFSGKLTGHSLGSDLLYWALGITAGYLPVILMIIFSPDFAEMFLEGIRHMFEFDSINLPLPVPWPWTLNFGNHTFLEVLRHLLIGLIFLGLPIFILAGTGLLVRDLIKSDRRLSPVFIASIFMTLPYSHHTFSRADLPHLAQSIFPLLIGVFSLLAARNVKASKLIAVLACCVSLLVMLPKHPGWQSKFEDGWQTTTVGSDLLKVAPGSARSLAFLKMLKNTYAANGEPFVVTPKWPGAYAMFGQKSVVWEIYALHPRSASFQQDEIDRIKKTKPAFILILDRKRDGREELRFKNTHPLIQQFVNENYHMPINANRTGSNLIYLPPETSAQIP